MSIYNLGSINIDKVYTVPHLVAAGETLSATAYSEGLGGKGANMSVAAARAAARVIHIGAIGADGRWAAERLLEYGVDTRHVTELAGATGHANICVDAHGENTIVLFPGANRQISESAIGAALADASPGDTFVTQNETNAQAYAAKMACDLGLRVVYAAAPFDAASVEAVMDLTDLLVLNEIEAGQLVQEIGTPLADLPVAHIVVTMGAKGCQWLSGTAEPVAFPAQPVTAVDTTGAGDTFTGFLIAGLDRGLPMAQAITLATQAAAIMVTRKGTADVIPDLRDIEDARLG